jgi:hypothetical protein
VRLVVQGEGHGPGSCSTEPWHVATYHLTTEPECGGGLVVTEEKYWDGSQQECALIPA